MLATMSNTKNNDCDLVQNVENEYLDGGVIHDDDDDVYNCDDVCCNSMQWVLVTDWGAPVHNWPSPLHDADDDDDADYDADYDLYIMSQKMSTSSLESPVTICNHP